MSKLNGKRGPKTKENIVNQVLAIKKGDYGNTLTANDIRKELKDRGHKESLVPSERVIYNILKKNKDKIKFNPIDSKWSLASLTNFPIHHDFIPYLLLLQDELEGNMTIRDAIWITRLLKVPNNQDISPDKIGNFNLEICLAAGNYAMEEIIWEMNNPGQPFDSTIFDAPTFNEIKEKIKQHNVEDSDNEIDQALKEGE